MSARDLTSYQRFLNADQARAPEDDYLFSESRVRFEPEPGDVLVPSPGLALGDTPAGVRLELATGASVLVPGARRDEIAKLLGAMERLSTLAELRADPALSAEALSALLRAAFGTAIFAPVAVAELERELSGLELVRFPGAPYEIVRGYWRNMVEVRLALSANESELTSPSRFLPFLQHLHELALLGADGQTFYRPASPAAKKGLVPGELWHKAPRTLKTAGGVVLLEGPRVNAALLGGAGYHELVCEAAGDPAALADTRELRDAAGLSWGRVQRLRAEGDLRTGIFFLPPRPLQDAHLAALQSSFEAALSEARAGNAPAAVAQLASFHHRFVRLHPFKACNQALCMNLAGYVLGLSFGAGMPHGILDHFALRLSEQAYRRVFRLAVAHWVVHGSAAERWRESTELKASYFAFVQHAAASPERARELAREDPDLARLALIDVE